MPKIERTHQANPNIKNNVLFTLLSCVKNLTIGYNPKNKKYAGKTTVNILNPLKRNAITPPAKKVKNALLKES